jgi:hypothetical protein
LYLQQGRFHPLNDAINDPEARLLRLIGAGGNWVTVNGANAIVVGLSRGDFIGMGLGIRATDLRALFKNKMESDCH